MKILMIEPEGYPLPLHECRSGYFLYGDILCMRDDYGGVYLEGGSIFWGGTKTEHDRALLEVQPVKAVWYYVDPLNYQIPWNEYVINEADKRLGTTSELVARIKEKAKQKTE